MVDELTLYCNCFNKHEPEHHQYDQKNLLCGSSLLLPAERKKYEKKNFVFDDTGDNISQLNPYLGDLTGLYYVWKNTNHEFVGTNQYRRFWIEKELEESGLNKNTLYISRPCLFKTSVADQFIECHGVNGLNILTSAVMHGKVDLTFERIACLNQIQKMSTCNMFFAENKIFNRVCDTLFSIVFELFEGSKYTLDFVQKESQKRMLAYLAERILTVLYIHKDYYFGNVEIVPITWDYRNDKHK